MAESSRVPMPGLLYSADWTHGLDSGTGLVNWIHVNVRTRRQLQNTSCNDDSNKQSSMT